MLKKTCVVVVGALALGSCSINEPRSKALARVAKDWCLTIRASQVLPTYPLTEDLQVGDVFLVTTPIEQETKTFESKGFLPLDNMIGRIDPAGWNEFYTGAYQVTADSDLPKLWQFPNPPRSAAPLTDWGLAPGAAFPSYTFQVKRGAGATLAIPISSVPVGLSVLRSARANGTVNITSASTYGLPIPVVSQQVQKWAQANRAFLEVYEPHHETDRKGREVLRQHYIRVVHRVYLAGGINVSLNATDSLGARGDAGASKAVALVDSGDTASAATAATNYASVLASLNQSVAASAPAANVTFASVSGRSVAMNETFPRPLVIGFLAFDRPIVQGGYLGPPIPTHARFTSHGAGVTAFAEDANTVRLQNWIEQDPTNRRKLQDWIKAQGLDTRVTRLIYGRDFTDKRAQAVSALSVP